MNCKRCEFSITDIVDVDEGIEAMLFCSYHDCLPEDTPANCDANEVIAEYTDAMVDHAIEHGVVVDGEEIDGEEVASFLDDAVPF